MSGQYQLLPCLSEDEYAALKADIAERGVMVPVELDEAGTVLDGHHRLRACAELGVTEYPTIIRPGLTEDEKREHVLALNLDRRHLTREQRRDLAARVLAEDPTQSDRRVAEQVKLSPTTVGSVREELEAGVQIGHLTNRTGQDGKQYPAHRTTPIMAPTRQEAQRAFEASDGNEPDAHEFEQAAPKAHVANNSGDNEWYTPEAYIAAAREVMGGIDLDPASTNTANAVVGAAHFFTAEQDGLQQEWQGRVFMNPPYAQPLIGQFVDKLLAEDGVTEAIVLVNNATETQWFQALGEVASAICFPKGRVKFWAPDKVSSTPLQGQAIFYVGCSDDDFCSAFSRFGLVVRK